MQYLGSSVRQNLSNNMKVDFSFDFPAVDNTFID